MGMKRQPEKGWRQRWSGGIVRRVRDRTGDGWIDRVQGDSVREISMDCSRRRYTCVAALVLIGWLPGCSAPRAQPAAASDQPPAASVAPITVDSTEEQIRQAVATARFGR